MKRASANRVQPIRIRSLYRKLIAAPLVQLRARLLLPADAPARQEAAVEADQLRTRLGAPQAMRALAGWLEQRSQLGSGPVPQPTGLSLGARAEPLRALSLLSWPPHIVGSAATLRTRSRSNNMDLEPSPF